MLLPPVMRINENILVVDDDVDAREILGLALSDTGFAVQTASDVRDALQKFRVRPPDLIISDLQMPGLSGVDLIRVLRQHKWRTPVVLLTGVQTQDLCTSAEKYGAAACLTKPAQLEDLLWTMDVALACVRQKPSVAQSG